MDQAGNQSPVPSAEREKFNLGAGEYPIESSQGLPEVYGDNRLVILPRDPFWFFAYWEFTPDRIERLRRDFGADVWEKGTLVLRVYDVTGFQQNGTESAPYFDVEIVMRDVRQWYVKVQSSGHSYIAELGLRLPDGRFLLLLRSNRIRLPAGQISDLTDTEFMGPKMSAEEEWNQFQKLAKGVTSIAGSAEFAKGMARRWEFLRSVFSGSSSTLSGSNPWVNAGRIEEKKG